MKKVHPRILFVGPMLGRHPGWVPNPAEELAPRLVELGYSCMLVSDRVGRLPRLVDTLDTIWKVRRRVDVICIQVYSGPGFVVTDAASRLVQLLRLPMIMVLHGGGLPEFVERYPRWTRQVFTRANVIVAPTEYLGRAILALGFAARIIPNAIELAYYPYKNRIHSRPNLLWMRTFHEIYNPLLAIEVFQQVKREHPHARLTMAGQETGMLDCVKQRVQDLGLSASVRFPGFLNIQEKQHEFSAHDIFLNTNRVDNMPISVMEAAAFGMPIVATAVGGLPHLISHGKDGLLTPDDDAPAMAAAVERILVEPGLAELLSQNARCKAEQWDWPAVLPQWDELFQEVA